MAANERSAFLPFVTAAGAAWLESPSLYEAVHPSLLSHDLSTNIHGDPTFTLIAGLTTLTLTGIFASRGFANVAKTAAIMAGKEDVYYQATDGFKKRHPLVGRVLLPVNLFRTR